MDATSLPKYPDVTIKEKASLGDVDWRQLFFRLLVRLVLVTFASALLFTLAVFITGGQIGALFSMDYWKRF